MSQTPVQVLRDMAARNAAIRRYARAHDRFAEQEQRLRHSLGDSSADDLQDAHDFALLALRATRAELDDPEPKKW